MTVLRLNKENQDILEQFRDGGNFNKAIGKLYECYKMLQKEQENKPNVTKCNIDLDMEGLRKELRLQTKDIQTAIDSAIDDLKRGR